MGMIKWVGRTDALAGHQECADRCTQFSGEEFAGGCKGYMTGMYYGMLYCKSCEDLQTDPA